MKTTARVAASVAVLLVCATSAWAYRLKFYSRRWFPVDLPRQFRVDRSGHPQVIAPDPDHGVTAALNAVLSWNGGEVGTLVSSKRADVAGIGGDGKSDIVFGDPQGLCTYPAIACTTTGYYDYGQAACCDGRTVRRYTDADVYFNTIFDLTTAAEGACSNVYYLEAIVRHEVGHALGLDHSQISSAVMSTAIPWCENRLPTSDDFAGRNDLYDCSSPNFVACTPDGDGDDLVDSRDNCPTFNNPAQEDTDPGPDGVGNACDNCPTVYNPTQSDQDNDRIGDACDNCPTIFNRNQLGVVAVVSPNGGERLTAGSTTTLTWQLCALPTADTLVDLYLSRNGTIGPFEIIRLDLPYSTSCQWTVTEPLTSSALLKVVAHVDNYFVEDVSNQVFSITRCGPCVVSFCGGVGVRCTWDETCQAGGCCHYSCAPDATCTVQDDCPASACNDCLQ